MGTEEFMLRAMTEYTLRMDNTLVVEGIRPVEPKWQGGAENQAEWDAWDDASVDLPLRVARGGWVVGPLNGVKFDLD